MSPTMLLRCNRRTLPFFIRLVGWILVAFIVLYKNKNGDEDCSFLLVHAAAAATTTVGVEETTTTTTTPATNGSSSSSKVSTTTNRTEEATPTTDLDRDLEQQQQQQQQQQQDIRIVARYSSNSNYDTDTDTDNNLLFGPRIIKTCGGGGGTNSQNNIKILYESPKDREIVLQVSNTNGLLSCMDLLKRSSFIEQVDFDYAISAIVDYDEDDENDSTRRRRYLSNNNAVEEQVPWGIQMIQADQVELVSSSSSSSVRSSNNNNNNIDNDNNSENRDSSSNPGNLFSTPLSNGVGGRLRGSDNNNNDNNNNNNNNASTASYRNNDDNNSPPLVVCIPDTGIAIDHPDLDPTRSIGQISGTNRHTWTTTPPDLYWDQDFIGHGTHIAGTLAAMKGNGVGVVGAAYAARNNARNGGHHQNYNDVLFHIHSTRALDNDGFGYEWDTRDAIRQCIDADAKIINLSLGSTTMSHVSERFYRQVVEELGILVIAAAGNNGGSSIPIFPASHPSVIAVSSVDSDADLARHSSFGNQIELAGPGMGIYSTGVQMVDTIQVGLNRQGVPMGEEIYYPAEWYNIYHSDNDHGETLSVTGTLVDCQNGEEICDNLPENDHGICVMSQPQDSSYHLRAMIENCIRGGGAGAIIFREDGSSVDNSPPGRIVGMIPVMIGVVSDDDDTNIRNAIITRAFFRQTATIGAGRRPVYTYGMRSGTSMAAAHVTSAAAILWSQHPSCTNHQIRYVLAETAKNKNGSNNHSGSDEDVVDDEHYCDEFYGYGVVQVKDALDYLQASPCHEWDVPVLSLGGCTTT